LNRATFSIDGRHYGAFVTADPDGGFLVESVDFLECWAIGSTLEEATGVLAAQVALLLIAQPLPNHPRTRSTVAPTFAPDSQQS